MPPQVLSNAHLNLLFTGPQLSLYSGTSAASGLLCTHHSLEQWPPSHQCTSGSPTPTTIIQK